MQEAGGPTVERLIATVLSGHSRRSCRRFIAIRVLAFDIRRLWNFSVEPAKLKCKGIIFAFASTSKPWKLLQGCFQPPGLSSVAGAVQEKASVS